jgi:hypothetical protein
MGQAREGGGEAALKATVTAQSLGIARTNCSLTVDIRELCRKDLRLLKNPVFPETDSKSMAGNICAFGENRL